MEIKRTEFPIMLPMFGDSVPGAILRREVEKIAKEYGKPAEDFSAKIELLPDPEEGGHILLASVIYEKGDLINSNP